MKKIITLILIAATVAALASCGAQEPIDDIPEQVADQTAAATVTDDPADAGTQTDAPAADEPKSDGELDVDLTVLSSTMVYSEVYNMVSYPEEYIGKTVKMTGMFATEEFNNQRYFACIIADATACCSQGIEFVLDGNKTFPADYPDPGADVTVVGTFETYTEGEYQYCHLVNAKII